MATVMVEGVFSGADDRRLFEEARAAWPGIEVDQDVFVARLDGEHARDHGSDLYLACACTAGDPLALAEFDRRLVGCVRDAVSRIDPSRDFLSEVEQILRERLLVGEAAKIRAYRGSGSLASWVRTAALRTALNLRRGSRREVCQARALEPFEPMLDPEIALLRRTYAPEIDDALRTALGRLGPGERLLLRFYYADGLTLARIAAIEHVGTTTVFRRLAAASRKVLGAVRAELNARLGLTTASLDSLIQHVRGDVHLSFHRLLDDSGAPSAQ